MTLHVIEESARDPLKLLRAAGDADFFREDLCLR